MQQRRRLRIRLNGPGGASRGRSGGGEEPALQQYLREIGPRATLTREEEVDLARRVQRHRRARRDALLGIPFVASFVTRRAAWLRERERMVGTLAELPREERGPAATARVEALLRELEGLLDPEHGERDPRTGRPAPSLAARIEDSLRALPPTDAVLADAQRELRAHREALPGDPPAERGRRLAELGLDPERFERRMAELERAEAALLTAKNELVERNLKLVVKAASQFQGMGVSFLDLVQEANLGLMRAVEKFDPERANRFSTYAVWWIQQALIRAVQRHSRAVRLPSHVYDRLLRYGRTRAELEHRLGREPESAETSEALGLSGEETRTLEAVSQRPVALSATAYADAEGSESSIGDHLPDAEAPSAPEIVDRSGLEGRVRAMLPRLAERERRILHWRFGLDGGEPKTLEQVGGQLGLSRERTRQIETAGLSKLRRIAGERGLRGLL